MIIFLPIDLIVNNRLDSGFDALKYSAPKEPKKKKTSSTPVTTSTSSADDDLKFPTKPASSATPATAVKAGTPGPSKVLSSAAVRLYRVNAHTRAYEAMDNGNMLGCVIMGTGINYQILIYNAQVSLFLFTYFTIYYK